MDNNKLLFYASGVFSLAFFFLFLSLFAYMMFGDSKQEHFALKKDNFISVSIDLATTSSKNSQDTVDKTVELPQNTSEVNEELSEDVQDVDVGDLFNQVWTKDITKEKVKEKKPEDKKRFQEIQKRLKKSEKKEQVSVTKKLQELAQESESSSKSSTSSGDVVNEFRAKLQALVYQHFHPPQNSQGHSVRAVIKLSASGKVLDFRILNYSANQALNNECDNIKIRLMKVQFPSHPDNVSGNYIIILKAEE